MRIEARLFEILTALFILVTVVYAVLTSVFRGQVEWAGTTALALTAGLRLIIGTFSPHSWWPILAALSFSVAAVGAALWLPWLIAAGIVFVLASVSGWVFEYYIGPEKH